MRFTVLFLLLVTQLSFALVISPNTIISSDRIYRKESLDMTNGSFIIRNNAKLTIDGSQIIGKVSADNPNLILVELGSLELTNNVINVSAPSIAPHPLDQSMQYVIKLEKAQVNLQNNAFSMIDPFAAGLMITSSSILTSNINVSNNLIENFHGALYLVHSDNAIVDHNILRMNSYGNIVMVGKGGKIINNEIYFSGRDHLGNSIDVINSSDILVDNNTLFTATCHGLYVYLSNNVEISHNKITGGITHAITLLSQPESYLSSFQQNKAALNSQNIMIHDNYMSQNRYGIAANDINGLYIRDNYFSQHFADKAARQFWTDNSILLKNVSNLVWSRNHYKEAFTQENGGSNAQVEVVDYPQSGGVVLP